jgi:hypothetical protein
MSNIFYSQVDDAVQLELNARGNAGKKIVVLKTLTLC